MIVGIVGLGLISGSMAKAYAKARHTVLAANRSKNTFCHYHFTSQSPSVTAPLKGSLGATTRITGVSYEHHSHFRIPQL